MRMIVGPVFERVASTIRPGTMLINQTADNLHEGMIIQLPNEHFFILVCKNTPILAKHQREDERMREIMHKHAQFE